MKKKNNALQNEATPILKRWVSLFVWFTLFLILTQTIGIIIHESGHYMAGRAFGCDNLTISIAKPSFQDSFSNVSGWESCKTPLVIAEDGSRICNLKTNIIGFSGLGLSLLIFISIFLLINHFLKRKYKKYCLKGLYLALFLIILIIQMIVSAKWDLFKIGECLFNTQMGELIFDLISILPNLVIIPVMFLMLRDFLKILNFKSQN